MEKYITQLAILVSNLEVQGFGKWTSQTIMNLIQESKTITLRSGKESKTSSQNTLVSTKRRQAEKETEITFEKFSQGKFSTNYVKFY